MALSRGHHDAWAAAIYTRDRTWDTQEHVGSAAGHELSSSMTTEAIAMVARVYVRTVGEDATGRPPLFRSGRWVFAHSGTIDDRAFVRARTSPERQRQGGATGSDLLFAFLLTRLDQRGLTEKLAPEDIDDAIVSATAELSHGLIGSGTFLLSNGDTLYAYRFGRALHLLEQRGPGIATLVALASEPLTESPWTALDDKTLVRCRRGQAALDVRFLAGRDLRLASPTSDVELPFTD